MGRVSGPPEVIESITIYRDADGTYAATWSAGGTWDHPTIADALDTVADALVGGDHAALDHDPAPG